MLSSLFAEFRFSSSSSFACKSLGDECGRGMCTVVELTARCKQLHTLTRVSHLQISLGEGSSSALPGLPACIQRRGRLEAAEGV